MENTLFLLGGRDLEMQEIARILKETGIKFFDKQLRWDTAKLGAYQEELEAFRDKPYSIYGVELQEDKYGDECKNTSIPDNYMAIDHHNENSSRKSSLEQVADLLGVKLSRFQQLVAANDSAYIDGLRALKATSEDIKRIRSLDRQAQGVTEEEEQDAIHAINEAQKLNRNLWLIKSRHSGFSPICDRLNNVVDGESPIEDVPHNYLIYTDKEWTFYGYACDYVKDFLFYSLYPYTEDKEKNKANEEKKQGIYSGGTSHGYLGRKAGSLSGEELKKEIDDIVCAMSGFAYSTHIFSFPFIWKNAELAKWEHCMGSPFWECCNANRFWERNDSVMETETEESHDLYDEANFFYKFTHPVMYDMAMNGNKPGMPCNSHILHWERKEMKERPCTYCIYVGGKRYELDLRHINLNFYRTGVGMLSFYLENNRYGGFDDILDINQFGRRIFPPFWDDIHKEKRAQLADRIEITGLYDGLTVSEDFKGFCYKDTWKPALFIEQLIHDFHPQIHITPAVDDRMFVTCWYQNATLSKRLANRPNYGKSAEWFRYVFIDRYDPSCQDERMMSALLEQATNPRWRKYGTMYGITRYSFMVLTDGSSFAIDKIRKDINTIYARMVELALMQRATALKISDDVGSVNIWTGWQERNTQQELQERIESIYRNYVFFINQMYHRHITAQEQGTELYDTLHRQLDIERQVKDLNEEIGELHNYISVINDQVSKKRDSYFNVMAGVFIPTSIITGLFGMNQWVTCEQRVILFVEFFIVALLTVLCIFIFQYLGWIQISFRKCYKCIKSRIVKKK